MLDSLTPPRRYQRHRGYTQVDDAVLREIGELFETPAAALAFAIVRAAVLDLRAPSPRVRGDAWAFLQSASCAAIMSGLGLDLDAVRSRCARIGPRGGER